VALDLAVDAHLTSVHQRERARRQPRRLPPILPRSARRW
jgi:hypothetical protein